ncbi:MAG TPA: sigma factor-like helix-turn-helix DNA-binding protein [Verrucomicrobiae bacterium]|nr:sigma factor-like helix-turn-helix DNA-binding protein [Verrucomicrobiae bacterium]
MAIQTSESLLEAPATDEGLALREALADKAAVPDEEASQTECARAVRRAVETLPSDMRELVVLCEWEELSVNNAAAVLSTTPQAVESRL